MDQQHVAIEAQSALIVVLQGWLLFMEDQVDILMRDCACPPAPPPEVIDLTDDNDEGMLVEIEEIGGLIEYV